MTSISCGRCSCVFIHSHVYMVCLVGIHNLCCSLRYWFRAKGKLSDDQALHR